MVKAAQEKKKDKAGYLAAFQKQKRIKKASKPTTNGFCMAGNRRKGPTDRRKTQIGTLLGRLGEQSREIAADYKIFRVNGTPPVFNKPRPKKAGATKAKLKKFVDFEDRRTGDPDRRTGVRDMRFRNRGPFIDPKTKEKFVLRSKGGKMRRTKPTREEDA